MAAYLVGDRGGSSEAARAATAASAEEVLEYQACGMV